MFFKNIIWILIIITLSFIGIFLYNFFLINYIIYLLHVVKSTKYKIKYKFIQIEKKHIQKNIPTFLLIIELIKIVNFVQLYIYFKKYKKYNGFYLTLLGYFFIPFKINFILLFIMLNYPFNKNLNAYLVFIINDLIDHWADFKIEFFVDFISFNGKNKDNLFAFVHSIYINYITSVMNTNNNNFNYVLEQQTKDLINSSNPLLQIEVSNILLYKNGIPITKVPHPTILNKYTNYLVNITKNTKGLSIEKLEGKTSLIMEKKNLEFPNNGVVSIELNKDLTFDNKGENSNSFLYSVLMHFYSREFSLDLIKKTGCFNVGFWLKIDNYSKILSNIAIEENLLKSNISKEELTQVCRVILTNEYGKMYYKAYLTNDIIEIIKEIQKKNENNFN